MVKFSKETDEQKAAFELYYSLGENRTLKAVAERIGKTEKSVSNWSSAFKWKERLSMREFTDAKMAEASKFAIEAEGDIKIRYRLMINNLMLKAMEMVATGKLYIKNITDFERLVRLDLLLMGENTEKTEVVGSTELSVADKERLDEIVKLLEKR